jgi:hypothetical protein
MTRQTRIAPNEAVIRNLLERRAAAIRAKDVAAALAPWTPEVVNYDLAPPLQQGGTRFIRLPRRREAPMMVGQSDRAFSPP